MAEGAKGKDVNILQTAAHKWHGDKYRPILPNAKGVFEIKPSQLPKLKKQLHEAVKNNNWSKKGINTKVTVNGEPYLFRHNLPKGHDPNDLNKWSLKPSSIQAKAGKTRALQERGPDTYPEFKKWAKDLGYSEKQIEQYFKDVKRGVKQAEFDRTDTNRVRKLLGIGRKGMDTLGHIRSIATGGPHTARNIDFETISINTAMGKKSTPHRSGMVNIGSPGTTTNQLTNYKRDFLHYMDHPSRGGSGVLPQKHETYTPGEEKRIVNAANRAWRRAKIAGGMNPDLAANRAANMQTELIEGNRARLGKSTPQVIRGKARTGGINLRSLGIQFRPTISTDVKPINRKPTLADAVKIVGTSTDNMHHSTFSIPIPKI